MPQNQKCPKIKSAPKSKVPKNQNCQKKSKVPKNQKVPQNKSDMALSSTHLGVCLFNIIYEIKKNIIKPVPSKPATASISTTYNVIYRPFFVNF